MTIQRSPQRIFTVYNTRPAHSPPVMDERVKRALQQWPNVPDVYGWLSLTRRGQWLLRNESVTNPNLIAFINRNYGPLDDGGYAFQNGPQRVHVALEATPWIARIAQPEADRLALEDHTGQPLDVIERFWISADGDVIAQTARGPALVHDQDLMALTRWLRDKDGHSLSDEALPEVLDKPENAGLTVLLGKDPIAVKHLGNTTLTAHFGFKAQPQKPA